MTNMPKKDRELPILLTSNQLTEELFQIPCNEEHLAHLRRHGGLPYVIFQLNGQRIFRYPREAILKWIEKRTHGAIPTGPTVYAFGRK